MLQGIVSGLDSEPTIAGNYCLAIASLAETAYDQAVGPEGEDPQTYTLSPIFELLLNKLLIATERADAGSAHLRSSAYEAIMELVKNSPDDCYPIVWQTMEVIMTRIHQVDIHVLKFFQTVKLCCTDIPYRVRLWCKHSSPSSLNTIPNCSTDDIRCTSLPFVSVCVWQDSVQ